jgi:uncharacterized protein (DUF1800 family)
MATQSARWISTARVLRRAGFGATGADIDTALALDPAALATAALAADPDTDQGALATPPPAFAALPALPRHPSADDRERRQTQRGAQFTQLTGWWLRRMIAVRRPAGEKLTLIWHNHFATSAGKVSDAAAMLAQNRKLRTLGAGDFRTLAYAMLTDAAMLDWLDGRVNTAKAPNENLAREFLELFALGHGNGYTEADVRDGARALTGWVVAPDGSTRLDPARHDAGSKTVLGVTGPLDAADFCDAVLAQPRAASYLATRTWRQLAADTAPSAAALARITAAYGPDRDLRRLVVAILSDDEFVSAGGTVTVSPVEWLIGSIRALGVRVGDDKHLAQLAGTLRALGQLPFYPPNVGGWPGGRTWLSTAAARTRWDAAAQLAAQADLSPVTDAAPADRVDAAGYLLGVGNWSDRSAKVLSHYRANPRTLTAVALNTPEYLTC